MIEDQKSYNRKILGKLDSLGIKINRIERLIIDINLDEDSIIYSNDLPLDYLEQSIISASQILGD
ncbi:MAG: hypothetical protein ACRDCB_04595 [Clostridium sp.]|uniref:hypothetical protein n=1 Tax=Clostridium TaxID=1485 RepID=UPI0021531FB1|nr:hypothetical protein [Clostridium sp. LY3-2]MCR6513776.1 hypothetical protein [Clostridium sp. LY3-2]